MFISIILNVYFVLTMFTQTNHPFEIMYNEKDIQFNEYLDKIEQWNLKDYEIGKKYEKENMDEEMPLEDFMITTEKTIKEYKILLNEIRQYETKNKDIMKLHKKYTKATEKYYESLIIHKKGLETDEEKYFIQADEKIEEYYQINENFEKEMVELADLYWINFEWQDIK